jgi:hypothetical protein
MAASRFLALESSRAITQPAQMHTLTPKSTPQPRANNAKPHIYTQLNMQYMCNILTNSIYCGIISLSTHATNKRELK